ncbi:MULTISPECIES: hypothetical protein [Spirulina sp. CCY15215]|uniref:hypothetical protein n=1 Tax=Spirulina sp. CCY15215 TaxID=2767591 RepID=UPI001950D4A9|nr:hypothetical protein [Spirulina major]
MILDWLKNRKNKNEDVPTLFDANATLRVIGDRASGKTAYMASLAYWPNADSNSPVQDISPVNDDAQELINQARNILEQGLELPPTDLNASAEDVKDYLLSIAVKNQMSLTSAKAALFPKILKLTIGCKDYAGEFFADLVHKSKDAKLQSYLEDCREATGLMFLVDGTAPRKDMDYARGLDKFLGALDAVDGGGKMKRIALVVTKCEIEQLWVNRHDPRKIAEARFPQTCHKLAGWASLGSGTVEYFTTSAFGVLGREFPQPNSKKLTRDRQGTTSVIKDPKRWRPFGLVAPIYWLCTGDRYRELERG